MLKAIPALAALAVASVLVTPTVSQAAESDGFRVSYADLDLASDAGQYLLQRRIAHGARVVCVIEDSRELALATETNLCRSDAIARAQPAYEAAVASARQGIVTVGAAAALVVSAQ
jgi:UrcA family protein